MTDPAEYISGRTVQEQMNQLIGYVDTRAAEVATSAIASDVADVAQAKTDAESARDAAIAAKDTAVSTVSDCVKKTPAAAQTITGQDLIVSGADVEAVDLRASGNASVGGTLAVTGKGTIATPAAADVTSTIVNMAYVSDTGGSLNNLVHRNANEIINGLKTFNNRLIRNIGSSCSINDYSSPFTSSAVAMFDTNNITVDDTTVTKESADAIRKDFILRQSYDGTNNNRVDGILRLTINKATRQMTIQGFVLVYENGTQVAAGSSTIATITAS